jgi:AAA+ ATPase superfamily predicted ATPase
MIKNPFKFGTVVDEPYFTNRTVEMGKVKSVLNSDNHLIIISPRRFGKTSLVQKVIKSTERPSLYSDLQLVTGF